MINKGKTLSEFRKNATEHAEKIIRSSKPKDGTLATKMTYPDALPAGKQNQKYGKYAKGGSVKGKDTHARSDRKSRGPSHVNVIIGASQGEKQAAAQKGIQAGMALASQRPHPPMGPPSGAGGPPPGGPPPGAMPPPGMGAPPPRPMPMPPPGAGPMKRGGGVKKDAAQDKKLVKKGIHQHEDHEHEGKHTKLKLASGGRSYPIKTGGGGGEARLEKAESYGHVKVRGHVRRAPHRGHA